MPLVRPLQPPCELLSSAADLLGKYTAPGHPLLQLHPQDPRPPLRSSATQNMPQGFAYKHSAMAFYADTRQDSVDDTCCSCSICPNRSHEPSLAELQNTFVLVENSIFMFSVTSIKAIHSQSEPNSLSVGLLMQGLLTEASAKQCILHQQVLAAVCLPLKPGQAAADLPLLRMHKTLEVAVFVGTASHQAPLAPRSIGGCLSPISHVGRLHKLCLYLSLLAAIVCPLLSLSSRTRLARPSVYLIGTQADLWLCVSTCGDCSSIQLQSCGYGGKGGYIQVGMAPPQVLIIYLHQPPLHMGVLHYQLRQQLHSTAHCHSVITTILTLSSS